ncbi:MAG: RNA pseudouridine synthase, partial [Patescibacteria group bacterium]
YTKRAVHSTSVIPVEESLPGSTGGIQSRPAVTRYEVLEQFKHSALVRVIPETGRTHQIRVHFFAKGNPVVGDPLYVSSRATGERSRRRKASRLMLHAERLGFHDLSGEWQKYHVLPSDEFEKIVQDARVA